MKDGQGEREDQRLKEEEEDVAVFLRTDSCSNNVDPSPDKNSGIRLIQ